MRINNISGRQFVISYGEPYNTCIHFDMVIPYQNYAKEIIDDDQKIEVMYRTAILGVTSTYTFTI